MKTVRWLVAVAMAAAIGSGATTALGDQRRGRRTQQIAKHMWMAEYHLLHARDSAGAAREFRAVLALDRDHRRAAMALADVLIAQKKAKQAVGVLARVAARWKTDPELWRELARARDQAGDAAGMRAAVGKALALNPGDADAHWILFVAAERRYRAGDETAVAELLAAGQAFITHVRPRGGLLYGQAQRAILEASGDEVALLVHDSKAAYDGAFTQAALGDINAKMQEARHGFEACVAREPARGECHYFLGLIHSSVKAADAYDLARARAAFTLATDHAPAWLELGRMHRADDRPKEARAALTRALELDPALAAAHVELAVVAKLAGDEEAAAGSLETAIGVDRGGPTAARALAELAKIRPKHPLVREALMFGSLTGDVFSTEKWKGVVQLIEDQLGGVDPTAPELRVLEEIVARLARVSEARSTVSFKVGVLKSTMVNAFALPDGSIYVTRGMFDLLKRRWPSRPIDGKSDVLGHVLAHEVIHVVRRHTLQSLIFQEAVKDSVRELDPSVLTHVTRIHEIEADREGIVLAFLAGFHPRGGIEFMAVSGQEMEIPAHLDHPTFDERVAYLEEYWTNDVRYAFVSFGLGVKAMDLAGRLEATDIGKAVAAYQDAIDHFRRFRTTLRGSHEVLNNLGVAYAKVGVLAGVEAGSPLSRWQTRFSLERTSALAYVGLARADNVAETRGSGGKPALPWQLREAIAILEEARALDPSHAHGALNLAAAYLAAGRWKDADDVLTEATRIRADAGEIALLRGIGLAEQARWDDAVAAFGTASASGPTRTAGAFNRARALGLAGKRVEARAAYDAYVKRWPAGPWAAAARKELAKL